MIRQCEEDQGVGSWWEEPDAGYEDLEGPDLEDYEAADAVWYL